MSVETTRKPSVEELLACSAASAAGARSGSRSRRTTTACARRAAEAEAAEAEASAAIGTATPIDAAAAERRDAKDDLVLGGGLETTHRVERRGSPGGCTGSSDGRSHADGTDGTRASATKSRPLWAEEVDPATGLRHLVAGRWLETEVRARLDAEGLTAPLGGSQAAGRFLNAMAAGEDCVEAGGRCTIGSVGSATHNMATKLRLDLMASVGADAACSLLRAITRGGRLHPGIAPSINGPIVNSEAAQYTPPDELQRMLASEGKASSPYL